MNRQNLRHTWVKKLSLKVEILDWVKTEDLTKLNFYGVYGRRDSRLFKEKPNNAKIRREKAIFCETNIWFKRLIFKIRQ